MRFVLFADDKEISGDIGAPRVLDAKPEVRARAQIIAPSVAIFQRLRQVEKRFSTGRAEEANRTRGETGPGNKLDRETNWEGKQTD
jgi:hypothetical protein